MAIAEADFEAPDIQVSLCKLSLKLPKFKFKFKLPPLGFPPPIPFPFFGFALSCDPANPIDVSAGLSYGGGRQTRALPDEPDDEGDQ